MARLYKFSPKKSSVPLRPIDRLNLALIGMGVVFAALGAGEAVYRLAFFQFEGASDRLPIEMLFGLAFAWLTTKLVKKIYPGRAETSARINLIWNRNHRIRHAVESIAPPPIPGGAAGNSGDSRRSGSYRVGAGRYRAAMISWPLSECQQRSDAAPAQNSAPKVHN